MRSEGHGHWTVERLLDGLSDLERVLGSDCRQGIERARSELEAAAAARDRGERAAAAGLIASALTELAGLGDRLGATEGTLMRTLADAFVAGLARDDRTRVEDVLREIESRAGKRRKP